MYQFIEFFLEFLCLSKMEIVLEFVDFNEIVVQVEESL